MFGAINKECANKAGDQVIMLVAKFLLIKGIAPVLLSVDNGRVNRGKGQSHGN